MSVTPIERHLPPQRAAARLARTRLEHGLRLTVPEATALIADAVCEAARDGLHLAEALDRGRRVLGPDDVLPDAAGPLTGLRIVAVLGDGTRPAVIGAPFGEGEWRDGAPGGGRAGGDGPGEDARPAPAPAPEPVPDPGPEPIPDPEPEPDPDPEPEPGPEPDPGPEPEPGPEPRSRPGPAPAPAATLWVRNASAVPIGVPADLHLFEANPRLDFDRAAAYGMRIAAPAGASTRFEPGAVVEIGLVPLGDGQNSAFLTGLVDGPLDAPGAKTEALRRAAACGCLGARGAGA
ncbi:urease subunit beta [Streptomyces sp. NPDC091368]|uniref:urease subunit beta n=1 Tax=Streptomyces sp. NPDC091368 TaxID=3365993 RepID=UPI00382B2CC7